MGLHLGEGAPIRSVAVARLVRCAIKDGLDPNGLVRFLFTFNISPQFPGLSALCYRILSLRKILNTLGDDRVRAELENAVPYLRWIVRHPRRIARRVFGRYTPQRNQAIATFLAGADSNPAIGRGVTRYSLSRALLQPCPQIYKARFDYVSACLTVSYISISSHQLGPVRWWLGLDPTGNWFTSMYNACLLVAHFSQVDPHLESLNIESLTACDFSDASDYLDCYADQLRETCGGNSPQALRAARSLAWLIRWASDLGGHRAVTRNRTNSDDEEHGKDDFDQGDVSAGCGELIHVLAESANGGETTIDSWVEWQKDPQRFGELLSAGIHPGEELSSEPLDLANNALGAAAARSGAVERLNQRLPKQWYDLADVEVAKFFKDLELDSREWCRELFFFCKTVLMTMATVRVAHEMLFCENQNGIPPNCQLGIAQQNLQMAVLRVRYSAPKIRPEIVPSNARKCGDFVWLQDFGNLVRSVPKTARNHNSQQPTTSDTATACFPQAREWYEVQLRQFNQEKKYKREITFTRLRRVLALTLDSITAGDYVCSAQLGSRDDDHLAEIPNFYVTVPASYFIRAYNRAVYMLRDRLLRAGYNLELVSGGADTSSSEYVGSPLCPENAPYRSGFRTLQNAFWSFPFNLSAEEFAAKHNIFVLHAVLGFLQNSMGRGFTLYLHPDEIDPEMRLASWREKCDKKGSKARFIRAIEPMYLEMKNLEEHFRCLAQEQPFGGKRLPRTTRKLPCYFLDKDGNWAQVAPATFTPMIQRYFAFGDVLNGGRHYAASRFREMRTLSPEQILAVMGHFCRGQFFAGRYATMWQLSLFQALDHALLEIFKELAFEPLDFKGRLIRD